MSGRFSSATDSCGRAVAISRRLAESFGVPFDIWMRASEWHLLGDAPASTPRHFAGDAAGMRDVLEVSLRENSPVIGTRDTGSTFLSVPFHGDDCDDIVALAELQIGDDHLARQLAKAIVREFAQGVHVSAQDEQIESLTQQVSENLEAITFLLGIAQHIDLCDISLALEEMADSLLPVLLELLHAEGLVYVAEWQLGPAATAAEDLSHPPLTAGKPPLNRNECVRLIDRFAAAAVCQPVIRNRIAGDQDFVDFPVMKGFLLVRVGSAEETIGWLLAFNHWAASTDTAKESHDAPWGLSHNEFGTVEAQIMSAVANMLVAQHKNLKLARERETLLIGLLRSMVNAVDAKDPYTCGHSERVALISKRLGERLGLPPAQCEQLYLSGLLHDIGKLGVPDAVLGKAGRLTDDEYDVIKRHPDQGHAILKHIEHLDRILPGVKHHHERFDGTGYPGRLAGEDIPLVARILAVADAYDAMASDRPYRTAMTEENILSILRDGAGSQWDPRVVTTFLDAIDEVRQIACVSREDPAQQADAPSPASIGPVVTPIDDIAAAVATTYGS